MTSQNFTEETLGYSVAVGFVPKDRYTDDDRAGLLNHYYKDLTLEEIDSLLLKRDNLCKEVLLQNATGFLTAINPFLWEVFFKDKVHTQPLFVELEKGYSKGWRLKLADTANDETDYIAFRKYWVNEFAPFASKVACLPVDFSRTLLKALGFAEYALLRLAYHTGLGAVISDAQGQIGAMDVLKFAKTHLFGGEFEGLWADFVINHHPSLVWTLKVGVR